MQPTDISKQQPPFLALNKTAASLNKIATYREKAICAFHSHKMSRKIVSGKSFLFFGLTQAFGSASI